MNMKITYIALTLYALCYAMLFGTWAGIVFGKVPNADQIVTYIQITLGALTGHVLTMLNPGRAGGSLSTPSSAQAGFARIGMMLTLSVAGIVGMLAGCATAPGAAQSPAQVVAQACLVVQATNASLMASPGLTSTARADLEQAMPIISAVCATGAPVDVSSLQALASTAFPALLKIADAAGLPAAEHDRIVDELNVGQLALNLALISAGKAPVLLPPAAPALQVTVPLVPVLPSDASVPK